MQRTQVSQLTDCDFRFAQIYHTAASGLRHLATVLLFCSLIIVVSCGSSTSSGGGNGGGGNSSGTPGLQAAVATQGSFSSGQQNASYNITVTNSGTAATSGTVTVVDPPTGFTVTAISGTGWTCTLSTLTCTRSDSLAAGASFPVITVTGNVTAANGTPLSIPLSLSGGGITSPVTSTPSVTVAAPALSITKSHTGTFNAQQQGANYTVTVKNGASAGATNAKVTVTETVPAGETLVSMAGTGWTCPGTGGANTCDRSDSLVTGASYPTITVTVNVALSAGTPQVNQVSVSGGGMTSPVSTTDSTNVNLAAPDASISESHVGSFGAGLQGFFNVTVSNFGNLPTTGTITVTDTLPSQFSFVSGTATGWTCGATGQVVTCTIAGPLAAGASAMPIPLVVGVSASASGNVSNTVTVATTGDTNAANNSATDTANVLGAASLPESITLTVPGSTANSIIYAGGNLENITVAVTNQGSGDVLTSTLTLNGTACTSSTCGTLGSMIGTSSPYTLPYTPPANLAVPTTITLTVTSSLTNSFAATVNFIAYPAGTRVVKLQGVGPGTGTKNLSAFVYNDTGITTGATVELLAVGYKCPSVASPGTGTLCGTLTAGTPGSGTTATGTTGISFTAVPLTYTPPAGPTNSPYTHPMILAISKADATAVSQINFALLSVQGGVAVGPLGPIGTASRLNTALTGAPASTIVAGLGGDTGVNKTVVWALTDANGANCQPSCGTLGTPAYTWNGNNVTATIPYTPPATLPIGAASSPTLSLVSADLIGGALQSDSFRFQINDGTCGTGHNGMLNGQYALLLQGGSSGLGYETLIGSFTADGSGHISAGALDSNRTVGPIPGLSIVAAGSSYSVGADNRGCLTLANSAGGSATYRIALGTVVSNVATQGNIVRFDDNTGTGQRLQGILLKQDPTSFAAAATGSYAFGYQGVTGTGARLANAGLYNADGAGNLTNFDVDAADGDGNIVTNYTVGSGTYSTGVDSTTGRGTSTITIGGTSHVVFYVLGSSEFLSMTVDALSPSTPIISGDNLKRTTTSYTQTSLDGNNYVFYESGVDSANGGNVVAVGQAHFTTNGANTSVQDVNDNGTITEQPNTDTLTIAANGRAQSSGGSFIVYLIGTDSGFVIGSDNQVAFGKVQQQTGGPFTNASLSGNYFFGGGAPIAGNSYDSGVANFNGATTLAVTIDDSANDGLSSGAVNFSYAVVSSPPGKFTFNSPDVGSAVGYIISGSKAVFMLANPGSNDVEVFIGQK